MEGHRAAALLCIMLGMMVTASVAQYSYDNSHYVFDDAGSEYRSVLDYGGEGGTNNDYYDDYLQDYVYPTTTSSDYTPTRLGLRDRGTRNHRYYNRPAPLSQSSMVQYQKSYAQPKKEFVPVVIKKKKQKKKKILTTHHGFFIRGGTAMFGKFKDLHSCEKACEITPTCFAGDFNPWLGKCFLHSNITACASMSSHKAITHFKKVPCQVTETPRGVVVLGASTIRGIEIKGIDSLQDCIKSCVTAGAGIAPSDMGVADFPQICCNIDYDFATHKCFQHPCINLAETARFCVGDNIEAPVNSVPNPSAITISFCPLEPP